MGAFPLPCLITGGYPPDCGRSFNCKCSPPGALNEFTTDGLASVLSEWESYPSFAIIISNSEQICLILPDITFVHICSIFNQFWYLLIVKKGVFFDVWNITPVLGRLQQPFHGAARIHWGTFPWCSTCIDSISIKFNVGSIMFSHRYHVISSSFLLTPLVFHPCPYDRWRILSMCHGSGFRPKINTFDRVIPLNDTTCLTFFWGIS